MTKRRDTRSTGGPGRMPLIRGCLADDGAAWAELWVIFDHFAAQPVRTIVRRFGLDASEADDVAVEVFVRLIEDDHRRLRSFRGTTDAELHAWLARVACNGAKDWVKKRLRQQRREQRAVVMRSGLPARRGLTEQEVERLLEELTAAGESRDARRLRILAGLDPDQTVAAVPARTRQRWTQALREKFGVGSQRQRRKPRHGNP